MNNLIYCKNTKRTLPDLGLDKEQINRLIPVEIGHKLNLAHMALGLSTELGELVNCIGTELKVRVDRVNLGEEIGDLYWYIANYCNLQDIAPPDELTINSLPNYKAMELLISSIADLNDLVKKFVAYNRPIEKSVELEAIYDIYSSLNLLEEVYKLNGAELRAANIEKLRVRYPHKFTEEAAINRDIDKERQTLENKL